MGVLNSTCIDFVPASMHSGDHLGRYFDYLGFLVVIVLSLLKLST